MQPCYGWWCHLWHQIALNVCQINLDKKVSKWIIRNFEMANLKSWSFLTKMFRSTRKESTPGCGTCRSATTTHRLSNQIRGGYPTPPCLCLASLLHCQCRSSKDAFQYSWPVIANLAKNAHPQQCEFVSLKPLDNQFVHFVPVATNRTGNECVLMVIIR